MSKAKTVQEAYQEGKAAAAAGREMVDCPYKPKSKADWWRRQHWVSGFDDGYMEIFSAQAAIAEAVERTSLTTAD